MLNPGHLNSTQTPFLHREGGDESRGIEFNRQKVDGGLRMADCRMGGPRECGTPALIFDNLVVIEEE